MQCFRMNFSIRIHPCKSAVRISKFTSGPRHSAGTKPGIQLVSEAPQDFVRERILHGLEQLALFFADVGGKQAAQLQQFCLGEVAGGCPGRKFTKAEVFLRELVHQGGERRECSGCGEEHLLLGLKW